MDTFYPFIKNEFSKLETVVVGIANSIGPTPAIEDCYDPKSKQHILAGTYPAESSLVKEIDNLANELSNRGIKVIRPDQINNYNQIFSRDIGFVVDDQFIISQMISERAREIEALEDFLDLLPSENVMKMGGDAFLEGGDIILHDDHAFIGYAREDEFFNLKVARTNMAGVDFIKKNFPNKTVHAFELNKSDTDPKVNALHLDCCFQPLGLGHCLIHEEGFKHQKDIDTLREIFGNENCITIDAQEMYDMNANVFSIAPDAVVSEKGFVKVNQELRTRGYEVIEVSYSETAKLEGLLRCSTLPIQRSKT
jgi:N-dimethylarginine dimethylaminohydrolase